MDRNQSKTVITGFDSERSEREVIQLLKDIQLLRESITENGDDDGNREN